MSSFHIPFYNMRWNFCNNHTSWEKYETNSSRKQRVKNQPICRWFDFDPKEASHINFAHKKRHFYVSLETRHPPPPPPPPHLPSTLRKVKNIYRYFWQRYRFLTFLIPEWLHLAAIKIVSKHEVVSAQHLMSDPRLPYKQSKFCEKQKELTDEFKAKVIAPLKF